MRSSEEVVRMIDSHLTPEKMFEEYTSVDIPKIPGLPKTFLLKNGTKLVLRNAKKDEDHLLYEVFVNAAEKGEGYSVHEFPSLNLMRWQLLTNGYVATVEEENTNVLIGFLIYHDSPMSRSGKGKVCDGSAIVIEGVRGKGFGKAFKHFGRFVMTALGYERVLRETFFNNSRVLNIFKDDVENSVCGVLPRGGFQKGVGWVDLVLSMCELNNKASDHSEKTAKCRL